MNKQWLWMLGLVALIASCNQNAEPTTESTTETATEDSDEGFQYLTETFADKKMIRYRVPGFDKLSLDQKKLVYYLVEAGLSGRDIMYDQNYRHNLAIRDAIDKIVAGYEGDKSGEDWNNFIVYAKNVWFSNGIHHHYSNDKFQPEFSQAYFQELMSAVGATLSDEALTAMFDPEVDAKKINQSADDLVKASAINFYDPDITQAEAEAFYANLKANLENERVSMGLNSKVIRNENGELEEAVYHADGMYGPAIQQIISWLEKAVEVAENEAQANALRLLIEYYKTGDLETWDKYNIAWVTATEGDIDYINSFIEVYNDPLGYKGSYENIVQIKDFDASERMAVVSENAQYFEDNSPIMDEHKKKDVVGITYRVVAVAGESGDASPATPIGVNLPNANWIRAKHGSKSVSLGNIIQAYEKADGPGLLQEFSHDEEEMARAREYGSLGGKMHTALHEVVGHASGQLEEGVATPKETLKNYASPLEEARADLVALYYIMDPKMQELGLIPSDEVAKAEYDGYLKNGYMLQLRRIEPGNTIEQAHMRDRQMISRWTIEQGTANGSIEIVKRDGKTYIDIKDYAKVRELFGELLREVQRIKSQGDYEAGKNLIETYGVQVDAELHAEVLRRSEKLNIPPYGGFINPRLVPVTGEDGAITDIKIEYPADFTEQMLEYAEKYAFLK
ncbi:dipeptidyl-peptidase 3 family protein [Phaeodactylibacter xiamenensis]|uniref:dipeptidyl-peptidase 3 family protein n=1 Tax=Phaeodactylibacter xiamenensis TaxID=1524460 RepID=UPI0024A8B65F|nr:dihydrofolate reductase [Phaeodactylibacter xiamenensis]